METTGFQDAEISFCLEVLLELPGVAEVIDEKESAAVSMNSRKPGLFKASIFDGIGTTQVRCRAVLTGPLMKPYITISAGSAGGTPALRNAGSALTPEQYLASLPQVGWLRRI